MTESSLENVTIALPVGTPETTPFVQIEYSTKSGPKILTQKNEPTTTSVKTLTDVLVQPMDHQMNPTGEPTLIELSPSDESVDDENEEPLNEDGDDSVSTEEDQVTGSGDKLEDGKGQADDDGPA